MENFELPEDLSALSGEDLQGLIDQAREAFNALNDSDDISNETLETMQYLADSIEGIVDEQGSRVTAAARKVELASKANKADDAEKADEEEDAKDNGDDEAAEGEADESKADAAKAKAKAAYAAAYATAMAEDVDVELAVEDTVETETIIETPKEIAVTASSKKAPQIAVPEQKPLVVIAAAVDVPQFYVGQRLDPKTLADAIHNKARMLSDSRGLQTVYPVATIERPFLNEYDLDGLDQSATWNQIEAMTKPAVLTASGGWCAPSQIVYDLFEVECTPDNLFALPTFKVTRGGIRWPVFVPHDETLNPGFVWTEANDIAATGGSPTKPCVRIPCPTFTECRLDATGLCITAGNLMDRAYPEQVQWFINRAVRAYERNSALRQLNLVLADTVAVTVPDDFAAASAIISALLLQAEDYRQTNGLCCGENLELVLPCWALPLVKADIARQENSLNGVGHLPTDAEVDAFFGAANLNVKYIDHWQFFGTHPKTEWPCSIQALLSYPGSYVRFDAGRLDLGVIRDSVLNATNDFTSVWFEEFYCVGRRGPQGRLVTISVSPTGEVGGRVAADGEAYTCGTA